MIETGEANRAFWAGVGAGALDMISTTDQERSYFL
jgi:hypothetical protein